MTISNGKITSKNCLIDTEKLGNNYVEFNYKDNNDDDNNHKFKIKIIDDIAPLIFSSSNIAIKLGDDTNLVSKIFCGDNYDRHLECKVIGEYDINKPGEYSLKFEATDSSNNTTSKDFNLIVRESLNKGSSSKKYSINELIRDYKNENTMVGIDVSSWQGEIDWKMVKDSGVEFAIIRMGFGHNMESKMTMDKYFLDNFRNAKENNILVGLYFFSYATTNWEAVEQVDWIISTLNGQKIDLPIAFDWESWKQFNSYGINLLDLNNVAKTYMDEINKKGYQAMMYGSASYLNNIWDTDNYPTWLAHYTNKTTYSSPYFMWQLSNIGEVPGINGDVDLNILYIDRWKNLK